MSKAHAVARDLPYLRRYARALTGSQTSGDAYVAVTLEALVKDPSLLDSEDSLRVTLFRLFSTIWNSLAVNGTSDPVGSDLAAERNLSQITAKPRQAFLLVSYTHWKAPPFHGAHPEQPPSLSISSGVASDTRVAAASAGRASVM